MQGSMKRFSQAEWATIDAALDNARSDASGAGDLVGARTWQAIRDLRSNAGRDSYGRVDVKLSTMELTQVRDALSREVELAQVLRDSRSLELLRAALAACT